MVSCVSVVVVAVVVVVVRYGLNQPVWVSLFQLIPVLTG